MYFYLTYNLFKFRFCSVHAYTEKSMLELEKMAINIHWMGKLSIAIALTMMYTQLCIQYIKTCRISNISNPLSN